MDPLKTCPPKSLESLRNKKQQPKGQMQLSVTPPNSAPLEAQQVVVYRRKDS